MLRNILAVAAISLSLAACAAPHKQLDDNPVYAPHQYNSSDMDISWKSERLDNAIRIEGTVTNVRVNSAYENLELEAMLLDPNGKVIAKQTHNFIAQRLKGPEDFKMVIPLASSSELDRIKFNYRYAIDEDRFSVKFVSKP